MPKDDSATGAVDLATQMSSKDPEVGLGASLRFAGLLTRIEMLQVDNARDLGWSWEDIARALGVSKQPVHEKHAPRRNSDGREA